MKILVASDIHGSKYYAQKIVDSFYKENADLLVLLGDIYNHGPRNPFPKEYAPMEVAEILNKMTDKMIVIQGNCDSEVDQMISDFTFVKDSVIFVDGLKVFATHGHVWNIDNIPVGCGDVLVYGHFHTGFVKEKDGIIIANPSSASLPKDNNPHGYLTIEKNVVALKDLENNTIIYKKEI